jgi:MinD-like ATPase involved in chromosome partitioning or flagellar assembly
VEVREPDPPLSDGVVTLRPWTLDDVAAIAGSAPDVAVPSHRDVVRSVNEGTPIVLSRPRSDVAKAFRTLAAGYLGDTPKGNGRGLRRRRKS